MAANEIREFLTTRCGRVTPEQAGLRTYGGRRRVPGLRREEVAMLAAISVEYYTQLERGSVRGVSVDVLDQRHRPRDRHRIRTPRRQRRGRRCVRTALPLKPIALELTSSANAEQDRDSLAWFGTLPGTFDPARGGRTHSARFDSQTVMEVYDAATKATLVEQLNVGMDAEGKGPLATA